MLDEVVVTNTLRFNLISNFTNNIQLMVTREYLNIKLFGNYLPFLFIPFFIRFLRNQNKVLNDIQYRIRSKNLIPQVFCSVISFYYWVGDFFVIRKEFGFHSSELSTHTHLIVIYTEMNQTPFEFQ